MKLPLLGESGLIESICWRKEHYDIVTLNLFICFTITFILEHAISNYLNNKALLNIQLLSLFYLSTYSSTSSHSTIINKISHSFDYLSTEILTYSQKVIHISYENGRSYRYVGKFLFTYQQNVNKSTKMWIKVVFYPHFC